MTVSDGAWGVREKIISDFTAKVSNFVETNVVSRTANVWPFNPAAEAIYEPEAVYQVVAGANNNAGEAAHTINHAGAPALTALSSGPIDGAAVANLIRTWMTTYSYTHRVGFNNTGSGNSAFDVVYMVVRLTIAQGGATTAVNNRVNTAIATAGLTTGTIATAQSVNDLIDTCQTIWKEECRNTTRKTYNYNYCHANHGSHANHSSRGRR